MRDENFNRDDYYLRIAKEIATGGTCLRRNYGAVVVKDNRIVSTGYTGAPTGTPNCSTSKKCLREELNIPSGQCYELCRSIHAELNAIINSEPMKLKDSTLYLCGIDAKTNDALDVSLPCKMCERAILNANIKEIVYWDNGIIKHKQCSEFENV